MPLVSISIRFTRDGVKIRVKSFVLILLSSEIPLDIIVLQETWELRFPNLLIVLTYLLTYLLIVQGIKGGMVILAYLSGTG
jgi:hypothetical protein